MRHMTDPFPPTPSGFHMRVEATLQSLEDRGGTHRNARRRTLVLVAAVLAALLSITAAAAVIGRSGFKRKLIEESVPEAAALVQESHRAADNPAEDGFDFSIDEIIWEAGDLYISYTLRVPEGDRYLVAMYNPTLNGAKLSFDAKGWTSAKFIDSDGQTPAVLLMGGSHRTKCSELWTFTVDPRLKRQRDNRLAFRAVLLRTDLELTGSADWTDVLDPPDVLSFAPDWQACGTSEWTTAQQAFMKEVVDAISDGALPPEALIGTGRAEYVSEREISLDLNGAALPGIVYNDVSVRDFDVEDYHIHIDAFHMTHLGISLEYTLSIPGATARDRDAMRRYDEILNENRQFGTPDGTAPGYSLGASGSAALNSLNDGTAVYRCAWKDSLIVSTEAMAGIIFAPVAFANDAEGRGQTPEYDLSRAILLTPTYNPEIAASETRAAPAPTPEPGEDLSR